ncbi:MAG: hypothetical protein WD875_01520 [Pirellulales bacterium]
MLFGIDRYVICDHRRHLWIILRRQNPTLFADNAAGQTFWESLGWSRRGELCMMQRPTPS